MGNGLTHHKSFELRQEESGKPGSISKYSTIPEDRRLD
jgi:hypothetical protein